MMRLSVRCALVRSAGSALLGLCVLGACQDPAVLGPMGDDPQRLFVPEPSGCADRAPEGDAPPAPNGLTFRSVDVPRVVVEPYHHMFGAVALGETATVTFTVENLSPGGSAVTVRSYALTGNSSSDFELVCDQRTPFELCPGAPMVCTLSFTRSSLDERMGEVVFETNAHNSRDGVFAFYAPDMNPRMTPEAHVAPQDAPFGVVAEGELRTQTVTVTNAGTAPLSVFGYRVEGRSGAFAASHDTARYGAFGAGAPLVLEPSDADAPEDARDALEIDVTFASQGVGEDGAALVVVSDDPHEPERVVALCGGAEGACAELGL